MTFERRNAGIFQPATLCAVAGLLGCGTPATPHNDASVNDIATDAGGPDIAFADVVVADVPLMLADVPLPDGGVATSRPLAPLSTSIVRSTRPLLRWLLPAGASDVQLEVCADRACTMVEQTQAASGNTGAPSSDLAAGVHWWRLRSASTGTSAVWELFVRPPVAPLVADVVDGTVTDLNGDGLADLVVSATHANTETGRVYVHNGHRGGVAAAADLVLESPPGGMSGHFGWALSGAGDVDGDGFDDLVVTAPDVGGGTGRVYVFAGGAAGLASTPATTLTIATAAGNFGAALGGGGDLNGDGYADVVITAPNAASSTGAAFVYLGSATGLATTPSVTIAGVDGPTTTFGSAVAIVGDANHDGLADVVIGASNAGATVGAAHVFYGTAQTGLRATPDLLLPSPSSDSGQFGAALGAAGDVNGDGYADLAIAAPQTLSGDAWIYLGGPSGFLSMPTTSVPGPDGPQGGFGWALGAAGDVNGDGYDDVVVAAVCAPYHIDPDGGYPTCGSGRAHVFMGSSAGMQTTVTTELNGPTGEPASFGWSAIGTHDLDGDGFDDVAVGAQAMSLYAGTVFVFGGGAHGLATMPSATLTGTDGAGANFGWSLALRSVATRPQS